MKANVNETVEWIQDLLATVVEEGKCPTCNGRMVSAQLSGPVDVSAVFTAVCENEHVEEVSLDALGGQPARGG